MSFNDDEQIVAAPGPRPTPVVAGRVNLRSKNNPLVPLDENTQKVMLEITGADKGDDWVGLDLVAVLDVSGSMGGSTKRLEKMKKAMEFVIRKLSPNDRLSIVSFNTEAKRECRLRQVTETSQPELQELINKLVARGGTNIADGLRTALKVLADRSNKTNRIGVMLMSDGEQNHGDARTVTIGEVPVFTFGFGSGYDPTVLNTIARNSNGGTFAVVNDVNGLSKAFSQCLGGLLTVVVSNLKLTVTRFDDESTIQNVSSGIYDQTKAEDGRSVTVTFGDLYAKEVRNTIVDLLLPAVDRERGADILEITYSYNIPSGRAFDANPATLTVRRTGGATADAAPEVQTEEARVKTASMIKAARTMADGKNIGDARDKLVEAQNALEYVVEQTNPMVDALRSEIQQLLKLFTPDNYEKTGRPFALSSETSHDRQRFASRGDDDGIRLFATPRMDKYLEQAKKFDEDPTAPLPSVDEDVKEEIAANPLGPISGPISFYIQAAIQALQAIDKIINKGASL